MRGTNVKQPQPNRSPFTSTGVRSSLKSPSRAIGDEQHEVPKMDPAGDPDCGSGRPGALDHRSSLDPVPAADVDKGTVCRACSFADSRGRCGFEIFSRYLSRGRLPKNCPRGFKSRLGYQTKMKNPDLDELVLRAVVKKPGWSAQTYARILSGTSRFRRTPRNMGYLVGCALKRLKKRGYVFYEGRWYRHWYCRDFESIRKIVFKNSSRGVRQPPRDVGGGPGARESAPVR